MPATKSYLQVVHKTFPARPSPAWNRKRPHENAPIFGVHIGILSKVIKKRKSQEEQPEGGEKPSRFFERFGLRQVSPQHNRTTVQQ